MQIKTIKVQLSVICLHVERRFQCKIWRKVDFLLCTCFILYILWSTLGDCDAFKRLYDSNLFFRWEIFISIFANFEVWNVSNVIIHSANPFQSNWKIFKIESVFDQLYCFKEDVKTLHWTHLDLFLCFSFASIPPATHERRDYRFHF